jgi:hypothetical protein
VRVVACRDLIVSKRPSATSNIRLVSSAGESNHDEKPTKACELVLTLAIVLVGIAWVASLGAEGSAVNSGMIGLDIRALAIDPTNNSTLYAGTSNGPYKSTDGDATWDFLTSSLTAVTSLTVDSGNPGILHMGRDGGSCFEQPWNDARLQRMETDWNHPGAVCSRDDAGLCASDANCGKQSIYCLRRS